MSNQAFTRAIEQIAREDEQRRQDEVRAEQRREVVRKVRKACLLIIGATLVGYAYAHRAGLGQKIQNLTSSPPSESQSPESQLGENLKAIQTTAQKRDAIIEDFTKK
jgi:hypothetical protein